VVPASLNVAPLMGTKLHEYDEVPSVSLRTPELVLSCTSLFGAFVVRR
jgi:hypothetical protein